MVTKAQELARANLYGELKKMQAEFQKDWVKGSLPIAWNEIPQLHPVQPERVKVTLDLDADMVLWFKKIGRGYGRRMNAVLRIYWHALISGQVKTHWDAEARGPRADSLVEDALVARLQSVRQNRAGLTAQAQRQMANDLEQAIELLRSLDAPVGGSENGPNCS